MRSPQSFTSGRGFTKGFLPALGTNAKGTPITVRSNTTSGNELFRTGRTPPPAPRLGPVPLPNLDFMEGNSRQLGALSPTIALSRVRQTALHRILAPHETDLSLSYDVSVPPSSTRLKSSHLTEAATWPHSTRMEIVCEGLPWPIEVTSPHDTPLTCLAVLCAIYSALNRTVSQLEWAVTSPAMQGVAWDAFMRRVQKSPISSRQGVQRLDFLSSRTWFRGLSPSGDRFDKWVMQLDSK